MPIRTASTLEGVSRAFHHHPELTLQLVSLFHARFDPADREPSATPGSWPRPPSLVENFNTGRRFPRRVPADHLPLLPALVTHTLKTNFFIAEKRTLAFRLDPAYLERAGQ